MADQAGKIDPNAKTELTDNEGGLLAVILRQQPLTTYQIVKIYERSPASSINESKGSVYPLVERLIKRGLVATESAAQGRRTAQLLSCTEAGQAAVREWVKTIRLPHVLLDDPLRSKVMSFDLLSRDEQLQWIVEMKELVETKKRQVEEFHREHDLPYNSVIYANATGHLRARMEWLDELLRLVVKG